MRPTSWMTVLNKRKRRRKAPALIPLGLWILLASCESQPPVLAPLNDILQHFLAIRASLERKPLDLSSVLTDASHIEKSAEALGRAYTDPAKKDLAKRLQEDARGLRVAVSKKDNERTRVLLGRIETVLKDLKAL
ncbi:MAG: hypothetical protein QGF68_04480 [Nitrospinota bacterium]|nr:hypothetical protein [Nitrospinota bacterium]